MAVIPWQVVTTPVDGQNIKLVKWADLAAGDTGAPFMTAAYSDKSVQFVGTSGNGITIQGSLDTSDSTSDWETLNDPQGNALSGVASDKLENILEHCYQVRPNCVAAGGMTGATVWLLLASTR